MLKINSQAVKDFFSSSAPDDSQEHKNVVSLAINEVVEKGTERTGLVGGAYTPCASAVAVELLKDLGILVESDKA